MSQDLKNSKVSPRGWGVGRGLEYKGSYWGVLTCRHVPNYCFQVAPLVSMRFINHHWHKTSTLARILKITNIGVFKRAHMVYLLSNIDEQKSEPKAIDSNLLCPYCTKITSISMETFLVLSLTQCTCRCKCQHLLLTCRVHATNFVLTQGILSSSAYSWSCSWMWHNCHTQAFLFPEFFSHISTLPTFNERDETQRLDRG